MPNLTTPIPPPLSGQTTEDLKRLKEWGTALIDELVYLFNNLDAGNVSEASSVKAENIDTKNAKISNAQIGALSAEKLTAGTIDTKKVTISDKEGSLELSDSKIVIRDNMQDRFLAQYDKTTDKFMFLLYNEDGEPTIYLNSNGDAIFTGSLQGSTLYGSTIIGTDSLSYETQTGGVFAQLDPTGIKIMQDTDGIRQQKTGIAVSDDGTAYLVLGAGNGEGEHNINGVVYTNGSFKMEKNEDYAVMGLSGYSPHIFFWENSGELWLSGDRVLVNGIDINSKIENIEKRLSALGG